MEKIVNVTFDGEVFRPDEPVDLKPNTKVKITIEKEKKLKLVMVPKNAKGKPYAWLDYLISVNLDGSSDFSTNLDDYLFRGKLLEDNEE